MIFFFKILHYHPLENKTGITLGIPVIPVIAGIQLHPGIPVLIPAG
jgi:hypothetical protein